MKHGQPEEPSSSAAPKQFRDSWWSLVPVVVAFGILYWFGDGAARTMILGLSGFLGLILLAIKATDKRDSAADNDSPVEKVKPLAIEKLGVVWLLLIPFGPLALYAITNLVRLTPQNWQNVLFVKTLLCVILPVLCVLPLIRFLRGKNALKGAVVLTVGTAFPVWVGWASIADLLHGPAWEKIDVVGIRERVREGKGRVIKSDVYDLRLRDGRELEANAKTVALRYGPQSALILDSLGIVIDTRSGR